MDALRAVLLLSAIVLASACSPATADRSLGAATLPPAVSNAFDGLLHLDAASFREQAVERGFATTDDGVVLDVQTEGLRPAHREAFDQPGILVRSFHPRYERVGVVAITPQALVSLAELPFVRRVAPSYGATTGGTSTDAC